jgi:hypothetical protein
LPKPEQPDDIEDDGSRDGAAAGAADRPRRKSAQQALLLAAKGKGKEKAEPPAFLSQRSALDIDAIFPLNDEYYSAATASQTMARRQDITMDESEATAGRRSFYGAGGSVGVNGAAGNGHRGPQGLLLPGLVRVKDEEAPTQPMAMEGGPPPQEQQGEQEEQGPGSGGRGKEKEEEEAWEAFDPSKLDLLGGGGDEEDANGGGGGAVDYSQDYQDYADDDFRMDDDDHNGYHHNGLEEMMEEEEPEAGRFSRGVGAGAAGGEEGEGSLLLDVEGGGQREVRFVVDGWRVLLLHVIDTCFLTHS